MLWLPEELRDPEEVTEAEAELLGTALLAAVREAAAVASAELLTPGLPVMEALPRALRLRDVEPVVVRVACRDPVTVPDPAKELLREAVTVRAAL